MIWLDTLTSPSGSRLGLFIDGALAPMKVNLEWAAWATLLVVGS